MLSPRLLVACWVLASLVTGLSTAVVRAQAFNPQDLAFFETKIRPVLVEHCYGCHSAKSDSIKAGLRVDSRQALLRGGDSGPSIEPGDVDTSLLLGAIRYEDYEMPPQGKLDASVIADFVDWIQRSAPWPDEPEPTTETSTAKIFDLEQRRAEHWAWQPVRDSSPPDVSSNAAGALTRPSDVDRFLLAKLEQQGISPAPGVDRPALARRIAMDITGLPPSPDEVREFASDEREDALQRFVDRQLESPAFGERWGRHWLDLVRYAESRGHEFDPDTPAAYQYRDYVIRALNADVPYDQFVREHIAGDLIDMPRLNSESGYNESVLGTGFWFLGEWVHSPVDIRKDESDRFDNMIDCFSKTFLAVTVSCARCHDHKFDAISTDDYYALSGYLQSSHFSHVPFESLEINRQVAAALELLDVEYQQRLREELDRLIALDPLPSTRLRGVTPIAPSTGDVVFDFTGSTSDNGKDGDIESEAKYFTTGFAYRDRPTLAGDWIIESVNGQPAATIAVYGSVRNDSFWHGLEFESDKEINSPRHFVSSPGSGAMRTPSFELTQPRVSLQVRGAGQIFACVDSHRLVAGPLHGETRATVKRADADPIRWVTLNLERYLGHHLHLELTPEESGSLELLQVVQHEIAIDADDAAFDDAVAVARSWLPELIKRVGAESASGLMTLQSQWIERRGMLRSQVKNRSRLAMVMMDGRGEDDRLLIRGNASTPGRVVPRHFLSAIDPSPLRDPNASGRLELASAITSPNNPLYSRVIVNRVWHHLFGRGIVPTVDDFGVLGERPTHPELLDHLATWFMGDGQSIKRLIRKLVLTDAYQRSGQIVGDAQRHDPGNQWYHHRAPKRLEAEIIRDSLLAVSGQLDPRLYGESIPIHLTSFMDGRGRPPASGPIDGDRRRSIYVGIRRNFVSPFMLAFDTPVPFSTMGRRTVSNVPAQALILMNDPFVSELAKAWASRLIDAEPENAAARVELLFQTAFARPPTPPESDVTLRFASIQTSGELAAWTAIAHAIFNSKEFIYVP